MVKENETLFLKLSSGKVIEVQIVTKEEYIKYLEQEQKEIQSKSKMEECLRGFLMPIAFYNGCDKL